MNQQNRKLYLQRFLLYFSIGTAIALLILTFARIIVLNETKNELRSKLIETSSTQKTNYLNIEHEAISDLLMLSESPFVKDFISSKTDSAKFAQMMISFIKQSKIYHQFRFIKYTGEEVFKINIHDGQPHIIESSKLQNKKQRYYFKETINLKEGDVFQSPIDLNIENEEIEKPRRIVVRYATPIFNGDQKLGIIVLNIDLTYFFQSFKSYDNRIGEYYILNKDGYYLYANNPQIEFGFMFPDGQEKTIHKLYEKYAFILEAEKYSLSKFNGYLIFYDKYETSQLNNETLHYYKNKSNDFHIIQVVPENYLNLRNIIDSYILILVIVIPFIMIFVISFFWAKNDLIKFKYKQQLIETNAELNKNIASQDLFLTILSHDLKNSLGGFYTFSEFIRKNINFFSSDELEKNFTLLEQSSQQQYKLLTSILEWKKLEMGKTKIEKQNIDAHELLENIKSLYTTRLLSKKIKLKLNIEENHSIYCDPNSLDAIIRNLIDNALKFSHEESSIEVTTFRSSDNDFIIIKDYGVGVSKEKLKDLFELRTFGSTKGTAEESGTGFGLKLVQSLVNHNDGEIKADSILNKGTKFTIIFPVAKN